MFKSVHLYMLRFKVFSVVLHLAGWILFMIFPLLFVNSNQGETVFTVLATLPYLQFCICYITLFYIHTYYIIPRFFFKKRYFSYSLCVFLLLLAVNLVRPFDQLVGQNRGAIGRSYLRPTSPPIIGKKTEPHHSAKRGDMPPPPPEDFTGAQPSVADRPNMPPAPKNDSNYIDITSIFIFIIVLAFSMAIRLVEQWQQTEQRALRAEADKANAELSFLKAQINPHFLYNTLNNIYTLSLMQSEHTSDSIMKLSNIMRYVIDDATHNFVSIESEVACISNYIDLQKLRIGNKVKLDFNVDLDSNEYKIAPLVLMTFVENLFKYGISKHEETVLKIHIIALAKELTFYTQNSIFDRKKPLQSTGIGIQNTKQRLAHLYPDKHKLVITDANGLFIVKLNLML